MRIKGEGLSNMWRVFADYHTHTQYSRGTGTILDNARAAKQRGLETVGIADHGPANWGHWVRTDLDVFERIMAEAKSVEKEIDGLSVLAGCEANIVNFQGELDVPRELQRKLDIVLAGFHITVIPSPIHDGVKFITGRALGLLHPKFKRKARNDNTKAMVAAVYENKIDIITHPGWQISIDTPELARACIKMSTALEINAKHGVKSVSFIRAAARQGVQFAIGSDAHCPGHVGRVEDGIRAAFAAGLELDQIINVKEE
jgi:putative hydrolase